MKLSPIIVALDYSNPKKAISFSKKISPDQCQLKIGHELFINSGFFLINFLQKNGFKIFLDLKLYDIPNTIKKTIFSLAKFGIWMVNVHASGGYNMMTAAKDALSHINNPPKLIAVTVLTSMEKSDLSKSKIFTKIINHVIHLSNNAYKCGLDGIVCSPWEAEKVRKKFGNNFIIVTPGIRFKNTNYNDQKRVMNPYDAIKSGSNYIVIGRPITKSSNPYLLLEKILSKLNNI
ncbi:pyrF [Wigglesworthia glossinidia endosymbiont of Glossina brevipalpis]|uniref:Orotidine 5'-phosphate decarboxylase n=1 Tax=Wigglesworthia glossinidia brevipalpis TaxID=36870 RepID=PYRF_WIGBR|nr:RecName: Full=Orotidine 5'-phosphate decarboxylase; AltName: Full=OMP decarboxylase; Short=OMPDCase; Short=OMPdecase [Wigglesworthia glossinidia endosymbiont of Glossina brevipalpis]BAC24509.1 pyrF [Wigglesworthia glossinidia endosymbiont of Glossina brevipalpis]